jgi:hypothetical protein
MIRKLACGPCKRNSVEGLVMAGSKIPTSPQAGRQSRMRRAAISSPELKHDPRKKLVRWLNDCPHRLQTACS